MLNDLGLSHWLNHPTVVVLGLVSAAVLLEYNVTWRKAVHPIALFTLLNIRLGNLIIAKPAQANGVLALGSALLLLLPLLAILWFIIQIAAYQQLLIGLLLWISIGQWQLRHSAMRIYHYIAVAKKQLARDTLDRFVLRDTAQLSPLGIAKATTEMLILRHGYQQIVVIFWFALSNIWVALSYRLLYELAACWNPKLLRWQGIGHITSVVVQIMQWPAVILYTGMVIIFNPHKGIVSRLFDATRPTPGTWLLSLYAVVIDTQLSGAYSYAGQRTRKAKLGTTQPLRLDHIKRVLLVQKIWLGAFIIVCSLLVLASPVSHAAPEAVPAPVPATVTSNNRIITLAPHLTELVYLLEQDSNLVAVSDFSDYPKEAADFPSVASYTGLDFSTIIALQPTHILAWAGGNKPQDIAKLRDLGFSVLSIETASLTDIATNIHDIGEYLELALDANSITKRITTAYLSRVKALKTHYQSRPMQTVFYYSWASPLMSIGQDAWANQALSVCRLQSIFAASPIAYPQVSLAHVIRKNPQYIINVSQESRGSIEKFWAPHRGVLAAPLVQLNPDLLHRFTPRIINEIERMCEATTADDIL